MKKKRQTVKKTRTTKTKKIKKITKARTAKTKTAKKARFTKKELNEFKELLLNTKEEILERIRNISENDLMKSQRELSGDISGYGTHMADVASDDYQRRFDLDIASSERKILLDIDDALKQIKEGKYGICQMCHKPITKQRLKAIPYAKYCKKCKHKIEEEMA